jgi:3-methylcrotonyl-CoA carboxylase beta subunit
MGIGYQDSIGLQAQVTSLDAGRFRECLLSSTTMSETQHTLRALTDEFLTTEEQIKLGGGEKAIARQHAKSRLTARERLDLLVDDNTHFQELGLWAGYEMYKQAGGAPGAGVVVGIGTIEGKKHMIIANDATVKAGAFFPMTCKKIIRAQTIAHMANLPLLYLVDSAGVYLPMQEDVFPDTDDFGRIFRNNAKISADGIPQIAAIMGFCVAGGGYLPVMCDTLLMTEGSGLYLAGQALVKAAIGQDVTDEELGGATMHAQIAGTIDFHEPTDESCLQRLRSLVSKYPDANCEEISDTNIQSFRDGNDLYDIFTDEPGKQYDVKDIISCIVDSRAVPNTEGHKTLEPDFDEYKASFGESLVCGYANIGGMPAGIVANQGKLTQRQMPGGKAGPSKSTNMPRVIYDDSADKASRFIMDCNQRKIPLVFLHDTTGFMVGRDSEQGGIIRSGAKLVNAMSNCVVPKLVLILGGSFGAGNYAMCGRAFDQFISFAWPGSKCAVMGAGSASGTLAMIEERSRARKGEEIDAETHKVILDAVRDSYNEQQDIRHGAARGWIDRIIEPHKTREELIEALRSANQGWDYSPAFKTGVLQV